MKPIVLTTLFAILLLIEFGCTYDNELDLIPCPESVDFQISNIINTACGAALGQFEVNVPFENTNAGGSNGYGGNNNGAIAEYQIGTNGFQSNGLFENLAAGTYIVTARLREGCEFTENVTIENAEGLQINTAVDNEQCGTPNSGRILVETVGASGAVTFSLNGQAMGSQGVFENLAAGVYDLNAVDEAGCSVTEQLEITAEIDAQLVYDIVANNCAITACHGGSQLPNLSSNQNIENQQNRISARAAARTMPPASSGLSLSDEEIKLIQCWANQ